MLSRHSEVCYKNVIYNIIITMIRIMIIIIIVVIITIIVTIITIIGFFITKTTACHALYSCMTCHTHLCWLPSIRIAVSGAGVSCMASCAWVTELGQ